MEGLHPRRRHALSTEWPLFCCVMLALAALLGSFNGLGQPDRRLYDWFTREAQRPANADIVTVAIDEGSIAALGRWPWPRRTHAQLLHILTKAGARAVGLDLILSEEGGLGGDMLDDMLLAEALSANGRTVLPVVFERGLKGLNARPPLPGFRDAAAGLGYTHFRYDVDGVVRSASPSEAVGGTWWPQFAWSVYRAGQQDRGTWRTAQQTRLPVHNGVASGSWSQAPAVRIPFAGPAGHFRTVSYADVLRGRIAPGTFTGKYVLVGTTAPGLTSAFTTPHTADYQAMSGIEIHANILAGLLDGSDISEAAAWQAALFCVVASLLSLIACRYLSPVRALLVVPALAAAVLAGAWLAFRAGLWLAPGAAMLSVLIVYPLWNWRRLEATLAFLGEEFARLNRETTIVLRRTRHDDQARSSDYLERRIAEMRVAALRARDMQHFMIDSLDSIPDPTLVLSADGTVILHNRAAGRALALDGRQDARGMGITEALHGIGATARDGGATADWATLLLRRDGGNTVAIEARSAGGREYLVKSAQSCQADGTTLGWIVSMVDISVLRTAERARDESLRFISHDMRAPQASILALLELQRNPATAFAQDEFFARIEKSVQATLGLADDFVHLAKAESAPYHLQDADLPSILADAADDMWAYARSRAVTVTIDAEFSDEWISVDRSLMVRAFGNLLSNAIKFSPAHGAVRCWTEGLEVAGRRHISCHVEDRGAGIPLEEQAKVFSPFVRGNRNGRDGVGLGLVFVKTVVERHGGSVSFRSTPGKGSVFTVTLPCIAEPRAGEAAAAAIELDTKVGA